MNGAMMGIRCRRWSRKLSCLSILLLLSACATGPVGEGTRPEAPQAPPRYDMVIEGEPNPQFITTTGGYFVSKTGKRWSIQVGPLDRARLHLPGGDIYTGSVLVEGGVLVDVRQQISPSFDAVRFRGESLSFRIEILRDREIKGFSFTVERVQPEYCVTLDLAVNGQSRPDAVRLGRALFPSQILPLIVCVRD